MTQADHEPTDEADLISAILSRFHAQKAAEFAYTANVPSALDKGSLRQVRIDIKLIPEALFSDDRTGLFIVLEKRGSLSWTGAEPMSPAKLMTAGVRPLDLAVKLSHTLNALVARLYSSRSHPQIASDQSTKELTYDTRS